jgi:hypothetical protein
VVFLICQIQIPTNKQQRFFLRRSLSFCFCFVDYDIRVQYSSNNNYHALKCPKLSDAVVIPTSQVRASIMLLLITGNYKPCHWDSLRYNDIIPFLMKFGIMFQLLKLETHRHVGRHRQHGDFIGLLFS